MIHDIYRRFSYIETQLLWGEGLTASELGQAFNIARQNAQNVIRQYVQQHPGNMFYDRSRRRHLPAATFTAHYIRPDADRFLDYQRGMAMLAYYYAEQDWADLPFLDADRYPRLKLKTEPIKHVLAALRRQATVTVLYSAKSTMRRRDISPHHLVFADNRYHVRAYCHMKQRYLDFVLTRIIEVSLTKNGWVSDRGDEEWHKFVDLHFRVNPVLPSEMRQSLISDYCNSSENKLIIAGVRRAVSKYIIRRLTRPDWMLKKPLWIISV